MNTHHNFWDCDCTSDYIKLKTQPYCARCNASLYDKHGGEQYPDSRVAEIKVALAAKARDLAKWLDAFNTLTKER